MAAGHRRDRARGVGLGLHALCLCRSEPLSARIEERPSPLIPAQDHLRGPNRRFVVPDLPAGSASADRPSLTDRRRAFDMVLRRGCPLAAAARRMKQALTLALTAAAVFGLLVLPNHPGTLQWSALNRWPLELPVILLLMMVAGRIWGMAGAVATRSLICSSLKQGSGCFGTASDNLQPSPPPFYWGCSSCFCFWASALGSALGGDWCTPNGRRPPHWQASC